MAKYIFRRYMLNVALEEVLTRNSVNLGGSRNTSGYAEVTHTRNGYMGVGERVNVTSGRGAHILSDEPLVSGDSAEQGRYRVYAELNGVSAVGDEFRLDTLYSRGAYVDETVAEEGEYPVDGPQGDYWYVRGEKYSRLPSVHVDGEWAELAEGFVTVDGQRRSITETFIKVDGVWKTLA